MDRKLHLLETFVARDDQGATHKVFGYEHLVQAHAAPDLRQQWEPTGVVEYKLANGEHLELQSDGILRAEASGLRLKRQD